MCSSRDPVEAVEAAAHALTARPLPDPGVPGSGVAAMKRAERLAAAIDRAESALVALVGAVDADGAAKAAGWTSTSAWMRERMRMRGYQAAGRLRVAQQLRRLPRAAKGFASGELSAGHVSGMAEALVNLDDRDAAGAEPILCELARGGGTADDVTRVGRKYAETAGDDDIERERSERQHSRRYLSFATDMYGMTFGKFALTPEAGARLKAAIDPLAKPAGADDPRSAAQRRADALDALIGGGQSTEMLVLVNAETLDGDEVPGTLLPTGHPLPAADVRRLAANAVLTRVILDPAGVPIDVGTSRRLASPALRKALVARDRECVTERCHMPAHLCQVGHATDWAHGGPTTLRNTMLECPFHNLYAQRHPERVQTVYHPDGRITRKIIGRNQN